MILSRRTPAPEIYQGFGNVQHWSRKTMFEPGRRGAPRSCSNCSPRRNRLLVAARAECKTARCRPPEIPALARGCRQPLRCDGWREFRALASNIAGQQMRPWPDLAGSWLRWRQSSAARLNDSTAAETPYDAAGWPSIARAPVERAGGPHQGAGSRMSIFGSLGVEGMLLKNHD